LRLRNRLLTARIVRHFPRAVHANRPGRSGRGELASLPQVKAAKEGGFMKPIAAKYRIGHGGYVSEFEQFINAFMAQHPEVEEDRKRAWYIWWDHRVDLKDLEKQHDDAVPVKPYQYE
jgi:hypothetical protein